MIDNIQVGQRIIFDDSESIYHDGLNLSGLVGTIIDTGGYVTVCFDRNDLRTRHSDTLHRDNLYNALTNGYVDANNLIDYNGWIDEQTRCWNIEQDLVEKYASLLIEYKDGIVYD